MVVGVLRLLAPTGGGSLLQRLKQGSFAVKFLAEAAETLNRQPG